VIALEVRAGGGFGTLSEKKMLVLGAKTPTND
jgi:hypothetical protein